MAASTALASADLADLADLGVFEVCGRKAKDEGNSVGLADLADLPPAP